MDSEWSIPWLQVLWLSGENEELTEVGTMNIFVLWKNEEGDLELVTPPLDRGIVESYLIGRGQIYHETQNGVGIFDFCRWACKG